MPKYDEYKRDFIIMKEEDKGYQIRQGKTPTGYVKLERKGDKVKLNGFFQDLVPSGELSYRLILLSDSKKTSIDLGEFIFDSNGRGVINKHLNSYDVMDSGIDISEFTSALVAYKDQAPLYGSINKENGNWRKWYYEKEAGTVALEEVGGEKEERIESVPVEVAEKKEPIVIKDIDIKKEKDLVAIEDSAKEEEKDLVAVEDGAKEEKEGIDLGRKQSSLKVANIGYDKSKNEREGLGEIEVGYIESDYIEDLIQASKIEEEKNIKEDKKEIEIAKNKDQQSIERDKKLVKSKEVYRHRFHDVHSGIKAEDNLLVFGYKGSKEYSKDINEKLNNIIKDLKRFEGFSHIEDIDWYIIDQELSLLTELKISLNDKQIPLALPYIVEGCGIGLKNCILGVKYCDGEIERLFIGIPGSYRTQCESCYKTKGFSAFRKIPTSRNGYWLMCIDLKRKRLCKA